MIDCYDFLSSVKSVRLDLARCDRRVRQIRLQAEGITAVSNGVAVTSSGDKHQDSLLISLVDKEAELLELKRKLVKRIQDVENLIDTLDSPEQKIVLSLRYCDGLHWDEVLAECNTLGLEIERTSMFVLNRQAISELKRNWRKYAEENRIQESL